MRNNRCLPSKAVRICASMVNWTDTGGHLSQIKILIFAWALSCPVSSGWSAQTFEERNDYIS